MSKEFKPRKIVDYIVVSDPEKERFCVLVKNFITSDYIPQGGAAYEAVNGVRQFFQAMIKLQ